MPKPLKKPAVRKPKTPAKPKRPLGQGATPAPLDFDAAYRAHMAKLGAKGGKVGGKRRLETMTNDERSAAASKAARAMWAKRKRTKAR